MKKVLIFATVLLFLVFLVSCENAYNPIEPTNSQNTSLAKQLNTDDIGIVAKKGGNKGGEHKVTICHYKGNGDYVIISVAKSAVQAHLNHGDMLAELQGEWVFYMNNNPLGHYYNFDTNMGYFPYPDQGPNYGGNYTIEEISGNTISCEDGTLSFEALYVKGTIPNLLGDKLIVTGSWETLTGTVDIIRTNPTTVPFVAVPIL